MFLKVFSTETAQKGFIYIYVWLTLIVIISLKKLNIVTKSSWKETQGMTVMKNIFTFEKPLVYFIDRVVVCVFPKYVYAFDITYYLIISFIFNLIPSYQYVIHYSAIFSFLCCLCIWLCGTLIQTQQTFLLLPK